MASLRDNALIKRFHKNQEHVGMAVANKVAMETLSMDIIITAPCTILPYYGKMRGHLPKLRMFEGVTLGHRSKEFCKLNIFIICIPFC